MTNVRGAPVLVVDDNATNLKLASFVLASRGYEVRTATDASEALELLRTFRPAVILLDLQMPGMDGLELARRLRSEDATRAIPLVAVTAFAMRGDEERARAAGFDAYARKPIDKEELRRIVAELVGRGAAPGEGTP